MTYVPNIKKKGRPRRPVEEIYAEYLERQMRRDKAKERKRRGNYERDLKERTLVGARVPRAKAQAVREDAKRQGISVYRWVVRAIDRALQIS